MAVQTDPKTETFLAAADLSAKRRYCAKLDSNGKAVLSAAGTDRTVGTIEEPGASGAALAVALDGCPQVLIAGTVAEGDRLTSDANGKAITTTTSGNYVFGEAMEEGVAGDVIQYRKVDYYVP